MDWKQFWFAKRAWKLVSKKQGTLKIQMDESKVRYQNKECCKESEIKAFLGGKMIIKTVRY